MTRPRAASGRRSGSTLTLEAILAHLSSGVLTVDHGYILRTANAAAEHILDMDLLHHVAYPLEDLGKEHGHLQPLIDTLLPHLGEATQDWRAEVTLLGTRRQVLMCRGSPLPDVEDMPGGHVIVFDDVTTLIQAQRNAAWGEVARRLAHEIKNPLTPIQLSAERVAPQISEADDAGGRGGSRSPDAYHHPAGDGHEGDGQRLLRVRAHASDTVAAAKSQRLDQ